MQPHTITLPAAPCCTKQHKRYRSHSPALSAWDASSPRCSRGCPARLPKYLPSVATQGIPKPIYIDPPLCVRWHGFKTASSEVCPPRRLISVLVPGPCPDTAGEDQVLTCSMSGLGTEPQARSYKGLRNLNPVSNHSPCSHHLTPVLPAPSPDGSPSFPSAARTLSRNAGCGQPRTSLLVLPLRAAPEQRWDLGTEERKSRRK